jgi:hypothetical protein
MRTTAQLAAAAATVAVAAAAATAVGAGNDPARTAGTAHRAAARAAATRVHLHLTPSSPQLAQCMPGAHVDVDLFETVDQVGFDRLRVRVRGLPPKHAFTIFLLEQAATPFGAAEYIGDVFTGPGGRGRVVLRLIVSEAFSSTLVNDQRVRVDLNRMGMWFADPAGDDFCLGPNSPVTPFDGDNEAGVQAFNSANAQPLPPP